MYEDGQRPSKEAKDAMYEEIKKMPGCDWYTKYNHSNWCIEEEKKIAAKLRGMLCRPACTLFTAEAR